MRYEEPRIEIIAFERNDIITLSEGTDTNEGGSFGDFGN